MQISRGIKVSQPGCCKLDLLQSSLPWYSSPSPPSASALPHNDIHHHPHHHLHHHHQHQQFIIDTNISISKKCLKSCCCKLDPHSLAFPWISWKANARPRLMRESVKINLDLKFITKLLMTRRRLERESVWEEMFPSLRYILLLLEINCKLWF